jgi:RNA polymerase sigma factor (sigma-70 family)
MGLAIGLSFSVPQHLTGFGPRPYPVRSLLQALFGVPFLKCLRNRLGFQVFLPIFSVAVPDTSVSLLIQLKDVENRHAWERFVANYGPLLYGFGLRRGIPADEADDFSQDVLLQISKSIGRFEYDPAAGTFRSWFFQIARHILLNRGRSLSRRPGFSGGSTLMRAAEQSLVEESEEKLREQWEMEYRRQIFARAAERVEAEVDSGVWEAFWRTAVLDEQGEVVAKDLGIAVGTLYVRRSRTLARVREAVLKIEAEWESLENAG